ncbi:MAG: chalcone isomerase family protein [Granulosicoccus sp.]
MQRYRNLSLTLMLLCIAWLPAQAASSPLQTHFDDAQLVGEARLKVMFWDVFDARLYADSGLYRSSEPFALSLSYLRSLDGRKIVSKSMEEIRRQAPGSSPEQLARWEKKLLSIIPDVSKGTSITGVRTEEGSTVFYFGNNEIGRVDDLEFTNAFFNIWLGSNTSDPTFRYKLLGGEKDT